MSARQRRAAETPIEPQALGAGVVERDRSLHVTQLADVGVEFAGASPPQEHVAGRLHNALTHYDSLALVGIRGAADVGSENRGLGFLT